jgi:hypothetical protein
MTQTQCLQIIICSFDAGIGQFGLRGESVTDCIGFRVFHTQTLPAQPKPDMLYLGW